MANFRTKARAIDLLGKNQIADLPTAITELWKNGYDAYGDNLEAFLYKAGYEDVLEDIFILSDDGVGMSKEDILEKWIVLGTDSKRDEMEKILKTNTDEEYKRLIFESEGKFGKPYRVPLGEKGIGRLSVAYLGCHMLMITKKEEFSYGFVFMNWKILDNYELYIDEVEIPVLTFEHICDLPGVYTKAQEMFKINFENEKWKDFDSVRKEVESDLESYKVLPETVINAVNMHFAKYAHGTMFLTLNPINELKKLGEDEVQEEDEKEEDRTSRRYIQSTLSGLFNPFDEGLIEARKKILGNKWAESPRFIIFDKEGPHDFLKLGDCFSLNDFDACEHWIDGWFDEQGAFSGRIKIFGKEEDYSFLPRGRKRKVSPGRMRLKVAFWEGMLKNSSMPPETWREISRKGEEYSGLYVYRDGFRVLPYGRTEFDFLGFEKNRSKSAGTYYFSHRKMFGYIGITKNGNRGLIDKSGREGLIANEEYSAMKGILSTFFVQIAKDKYGTYAPARKDYVAERKKEAEREELIQNEVKDNYQALSELNKRLNNERKDLDVVKEEREKIEARFAQQASQDEINELYKKASDLLCQIKSSQVRVAPDVTLYGFDSLQDRISEYEEDRKAEEKRVLSLHESIRKKATLLAMKKEYAQRFESLSTKIADRKNVNLECLDTELTRLQKEYVLIEEQVLSMLMKMAPENDSDLQFAELVARQNELYSIEDKWRKQEDGLITPFLARLKGVSITVEWLKTFEAYHSRERELSEQIKQFYELAQTGMALEIIDHQYNVMYAKMSEAIREIEHTIPPEARVRKAVDSLVMAFNHMEANEKLLTPLYRTTRRNVVKIEGRDIRDTIEVFYGDIFDKRDIEFECTDEFLEYSFMSYPSVIMPVFINVINNAIYWVIYNTKQRIIKCDIKDGKIRIQNSGPKMTASEIDRCFELFYSKKPTGRGVGLYLARKSLENVGLLMCATNDPDMNELGGACFLIMTKEDGDSDDI